jgi:hypothetical protein
MQGTPAGLPSGMPGIGDEIDGAMQQAEQALRQFIAADLISFIKRDASCLCYS